MSDGGFVLDTPEQIAAFQLLRLRAALGFEIRAGIPVHSGVSTMNYIRGMGISTKRTKKGVYADLNAYIVSVLGETYNRPL
jgi:hypothetical protein